MNFAKRCCADDANLCEVISVAPEEESASQGFIDELLDSNRFNVQYRKQLEKTSAIGTAGAYVYLKDATYIKDVDKTIKVKGGKIRINYCEADCIIPLTVENDLVTECAFCSTNRVKGKEQTMLVITNYSAEEAAWQIPEELKGKKFQKKRNHLNRFRQEHPEHTLEPITEKNLPEVTALVNHWYDLRLQENPHADYHMERSALTKALQQRETLGMEGLALRTKDGLVAMTMGSRLNPNTFDIHFEKALDIADGAYAAINNGFARYLRDKHPDIQFLNREDDLGLEGLRKAKLSYNPHHMVEKHWACLMEDGYDY